MMQFIITYLGDTSICNTFQSACYSILNKRRRNTNNCDNDRENVITSSSRRRPRGTYASSRMIMTSLVGVVIFIFLVIVRMTLFQNNLDASSQSETTYKTTTSNNTINSSNLRQSRVKGLKDNNNILKRRLKATSSASASTVSGNSNSNSPPFNSNFKPNGQTVIAIGVSNDIMTYKQFVGSLRHSGYQGTILLGRPRPHQLDYDDRNDSIIHNYLVSQNVRIQYMDIAYGDECQSNLLLQDERLLQQQIQQQSKSQLSSHSMTTTTACIKPYTNLKLGWTGHALARDWLKQCPPRTCTGPTLLSPLHHVYFQSNPFESLYNKNEIFLEFYEDHPSKSINDNFALEQCKKFMWENVPYMKSFVYADLMSMKFYLEEVVRESYDWMNRSQCYLSNTGIAIHNYLFYNGLIRPSYVFEDRVGLVHSIAGSQHSKEIKEKVNDGDDNDEMGDWITSNVSKPLREQKIVNENGFFLNWDGLPSPIVHQTNAFESYQRWIRQQPFMKLSEEELHHNNHKKKKKNGNSKSRSSKKEEEILDCPLNNPLYYLSLEGSYVNLRLEKKFLRKRKFMGRVQEESKL